MTDDNTKQDSLMEHSLCRVEELLGYTVAHLQSPRWNKSIFNFLSSQLNAYADNTDSLDVQSDVFFFNALSYTRLTWRTNIDDSSRHRISSSLRKYIEHRRVFNEDVRKNLNIPPIPLEWDKNSDHESWWDFMYSTHEPPSIPKDTSQAVQGEEGRSDHASIRSSSSGPSSPRRSEDSQNQNFPPDGSHVVVDVKDIQDIS